MHGEYKTPGGKLVVVDFDVLNGLLRNVLVSGDFFLYPEEVLDLMVAALEGLPANTPEHVMVDSVKRAIPDDAEVLGTSPEGIATAVQRALHAHARGDQET